MNLITRWAIAIFDILYAFFFRLRHKYDLFISYAREDADYAAALRKQLEALDFRCFRDTEDMHSGQALTDTLRRGLRDSAYLLVVGTKDAVGSEFVAFEVEEFAEPGRTILPIGVGDALSRAPWPAFRKRKLIWINETPDALTRKPPGPSATVITEIDKSFTLTKRNVRVRAMVMTTVLAVLTGSVIAGAVILAGRIEMRSQADEIEQQRTRLDISTRAAKKARLLASEEQKRAEAATCRKDWATAQAIVEQERAAKATKLADERLLETRFEQGRLELNAGRPLQALLYLNDVYRHRPADEALRFLVHAAARALPHDGPRGSEFGAVDWNADGTRILTDGRIATLWDGKGRAMLAELEPPAPYAVKVAASDPPSAFGRFAGKASDAFVSYGRGVGIFRGRDGAWLGDIPALRDVEIDAMKVRRDGKRIIFVATDRRVFLVDPESRSVLTETTTGGDSYGGESDVVDFVGNDRIAVVSANGGIELRRGDSPAGKLAIKDRVIVAVHASPDGETLACELSTDEVQGDGRWNHEIVKIFDVRRLRKPPGALISSEDRFDALTYSPDGATIVAAEGRRILLWDVPVSVGDFDPRPRNIIQTDDFINTLVFSRDGKRLAAVGDRLTLWNPVLGTRIGTLITPNEVDDVTFSPDGQRIAGTNEYGIRFWDAALDLLTRVRARRRRELSPDGQRQVKLNYRTLTVTDVATGAQLFTIPPDAMQELKHPGVNDDFATGVDAGTIHTRFIAGGRWLATYDAKQILLWDGLKGRPGPRQSPEHPISSLHVVPGQDRYIITHDGTLDKKPDLVTVRSIDNKAILSVAGRLGTISGDGTRIVVFRYDATRSFRAVVHRTSDGMAVTTLRTADWNATSVRFSPDGSRIIGAISTGEACIWDASSGARLRMLGGDAETIYDAALSPDGHRAATADSDKCVRLWDVDRGVVLQALRGHTGKPVSVRFTDADTLISIGEGIGITGRTEELLEWNVALEQRPAEVVEQHIRKTVPSSAFLAIGRSN
ncbi:MAG TPA: TIR domain-containing protein [Thermoanaerobaculia bacterium]|jgi:WD40 repeat protein|nr:TIR domain-containing protein [Thermoanaerobaculia bacterium]